MKRAERNILTKLQVEIAKFSVILERLEAKQKEDMLFIKKHLQRINEELGNLDLRIEALETRETQVSLIVTIIKFLAIPAISSAIALLVKFILS